MPDLNLIEFAVKAAALEVDALRAKGAAGTSAERAELARTINGLLGDTAAALTASKDDAERLRMNASLSRLLVLQKELSAPASASTAAPAAAIGAGEGYALYKLPSGVEVYTRRFPDGQTSESYYCPQCVSSGRTGTLEFKFGGGGNYVCPRCHAVYPNSVQAKPAAPPPPPPPPPPPAADDAGAGTADAAAAGIACAGEEVQPAPSTPPPIPEQPAAPQLRGGTPRVSNDKGGLPPPVIAADGAPPAWRISRTTGAELAEIVEYTPGQLRFRRWWANFGQGGFLTSVLFHILLVIVLVTVVVAVNQGGPNSAPPDWVNAGDGGTKGDKSPERRIQLQDKKRVSREKPMRIATKRSSSVMLPDYNEVNNALISASSSKAGSGGLGDKGLGGGLFGVGRGFTGMNVWNMKIFSNRLAVYLDNSGSMVPYLPMVKAEILKSFPNADIYEHDGIRILVRDGKIEHGHKVGIGAFATEVLGSKEEILNRYRQNFDSGSVGAWVDIMLHQGYDALIVFSDFEDGVHQDDTRRGRIYTEDMYETSNPDTRNHTDKAWEREWIELCKTVSASRPGARRSGIGRNGVKFYLFSIEVKPQKIWMDCVKESGGDMKMMTNLRVENR